MTTTAHRRARRAPGPHRAAHAGERLPDPGVRAEGRDVVGQLVDCAAAQAREAGRQLRCILRLWLFAEEDGEIEWVASASEGLMPFEAAERVDALLETADQLLLEVADEIGAALDLPSGTALDRIREALVLGLHLPEALAGLEAGRFSARHATVMADQWRELAEDAPPGEEASTETVRRLVAELRERAPRCTVARLRADVLAELLPAGEVLDGPSFPRDVRGEISVTVPVLTLPESLSGAAGGRAADRAPVHSDATVLSGHGPISAETARELAAGATCWHRILTHPVTGAVLDHDRTAYAVPTDPRRRLRHRDGTCRFPGCRRRAERCDLDHTVAWQDGERTAADDLAHLCRRHHLVKHRNGALGRWSVRQPGPSPDGGVLEWTSPGGRTYRTVPDALAALPPDALAGSPPDVPVAPQPDPPPF